MNKSRSGFTIVELLIVIVVIGILAAITIVAYNGVQNKANDSAVQSDLSSFNTQMELFRAENDRYPSGSGSLPTIAGISFSKNSYMTSNNAVLYCSPLDGSNYALIGESKSGKQYLVGSANPSVTTTAIPFPTGMANDCPALGSSQVNAQWLHANGAWASWIK